MCLSVSGSEDDSLIPLYHHVALPVIVNSFRTRSTYYCLELVELDQVVVIQSLTPSILFASVLLVGMRLLCSKNYAFKKMPKSCH